MTTIFTDKSDFEMKRTDRFWVIFSILAPWLFFPWPGGFGPPDNIQFEYQISVAAFLLFYLLFLFFMIRRFWVKDGKEIKAWCYALLLSPVVGIVVTKLATIWLNIRNHADF